ncbi:uncharacterized protein LOC134818205 [Bolinopsis microptera]|uniref:uncharacterized protein LOC134818205 n=1 Tax=Bolinopsis microptera TaxID=2820187 RepID=UPI003079C44F
MITSGPFRQGALSYQAPINLTLALLAIALNCLVINHLYKERSRYSSILLMLISVCNVMTAVSNVARDSVSLSCLRNNNIPVPTWIVLSYLSLGVSSYQCSIFFNMVLTLLTTLQILTPSYRVNYTVVRVVLVVITLVGVLLAVGDVICWNRQLSSTSSCFQQWLKLKAVSYTGEGVAVHFSHNHKQQSISGGIILHFDYSLPCLVILLCIMVRICSNKKAHVVGSEYVQDTENWLQHSNLSVFLVSLLYLIYNSAFVVVFSLAHVKRYKLKFLTKYKPLLMTVKFTLPLLTAVLVPLIITLGKPALRMELKQLIHRLMSMLSAGYHKMKHSVVSRRQGFAHLQEEEEEEDICTDGTLTDL